MKHLFFCFIAIIWKKQKKNSCILFTQSIPFIYFISLFLIFKKIILIFFLLILTPFCFCFLFFFFMSLNFFQFFLLHFIFVSLNFTIAFSYILSLLCSLFLSSIFLTFHCFAHSNHYFHIFSLVSSHCSFSPQVWPVYLSACLYLCFSHSNCYLFIYFLSLFCSLFLSPQVFFFLEFSIVSLTQPITFSHVLPLFCSLLLYPLIFLLDSFIVPLTLTISFSCILFLFL